jgi:hypothetical protein
MEVPKPEELRTECVGDPWVIRTESEVPRTASEVPRNKSGAIYWDLVLQYDVFHMPAYQSVSKTLRLVYKLPSVPVEPSSVGEFPGKPLVQVAGTKCGQCSFCPAGRGTS